MTEETPPSVETLLTVALNATPENVHENPLTRPYAQLFRQLYRTHGLIVPIHWLAGRLINTAHGHPFSLEREGEFNFPLPLTNPACSTAPYPHSNILPSALNLPKEEDNS